MSDGQEPAHCGLLRYPESSRIPRNLRLPLRAPQPRCGALLCRETLCWSSGGFTNQDGPFPESYGDAGSSESIANLHRGTKRQGIHKDLGLGMLVG